MKFLLINAFMDYSKIIKLFAIESEIPPLGLMYVASALEIEGHEVSIVDFCAESFSEEKLVNFVEKHDVIGITVRSHNLKSVSQISEIIKKSFPSKPIILGGPHCTLNPKDALLNTCADISVQGEGEHVINHIANAIRGNGNLYDIPGVFYKKDAEIKNGPPYQEITDLNSIPFPSRHLVDKYVYGEVVSGFNPTRGKVTSIMTSRGCPYNCSYCINNTLTKRFRSRSADNVIKELQEIKGNYDFLHVIDENFFADLNTANKILDFLVEDDHGFDIWISGIRVDVANKELFQKMKKAGVRTINLGIESGNQDVLDFYNKKTTLSQVRKAAYLARKMGFFTIGYFMLGAPIETEEHIKNTINFAKSLPLDNASFSPFSYLKGAPIWYEAVREGKISENEQAVMADISRNLGNFTEEEIWKWIVKAFSSFHLRTSYVIDQIIQSFIRWDFRVPVEGFKLFLRDDNVLKIKDPEQFQKT